MQISRRVPMRLALTTFGASAAIVALVVAPAGGAEATTRSGDVTVSIPSTISIDGGTIQFTVTSTALDSLNEVTVEFLANGAYSTSKDVKPNVPSTVSTLLMKPGSTIAKAVTITSYCSYYDSDPCYYSSSRGAYEFVYGLHEPDSNASVAKYGSKTSLAGVRTGTRTTWTVTAQHYDGLSWVAWPGASVTIGSTPVTTDSAGTATWSQDSSGLDTLTATTLETDTVWGSVSSAATAVQHVDPPQPVATTKPTPPAPASVPGHVLASATASKAATAMKKGLPNVRKVVTLTKKNDVNELLGKKDGYVSAAVLYDKRTTCADGPGVDCGATIEKFTSTAKAKARAKHIRALLKKYSFLGTEYDTVHGRFLLRVSGDLTSVQAKQYRTVFGKTFR